MSQLTEVATKDGKATVSVWLMVTKGALVDSDRRLSRKNPNIHRIGHYLKALEDVTKATKADANKDSPEALAKFVSELRKAFIFEGGRFALTQLNKVVKKVDEYLKTGKTPKYESAEGGDAELDSIVEQMMAEGQEWKFMSADQGGFTAYHNGKNVGRVYQEKGGKNQGKWMSQSNYGNTHSGPFPNRQAAASSLSAGEKNEARVTTVVTFERSFPADKAARAVGQKFKKQLGAVKADALFGVKGSIKSEYVIDSDLKSQMADWVHSPDGKKAIMKESNEAWTERFLPVLGEATDPPAIRALRKIVSTKSHGKVGGSRVDMYTASAVIGVYDKLNPVNKAKFAKMPVVKMADVAFKLMKM